MSFQGENFGKNARLYSIMGVSLSLTEENSGNKRQAVEKGFVALVHFDKLTNVLLALKELSYFSFAPCSLGGSFFLDAVLIFCFGIYYISCL